jgi:hypothetical protein
LEEDGNEQFPIILENVTIPSNPFLTLALPRKNDLNFKEFRVRISLFHSLHSIAQGAFLFDGSILHCPVEM